MYQVHCGGRVSGSFIVEARDQLGSGFGCAGRLKLGEEVLSSLSIEYFLADK